MPCHSPTKDRVMRSRTSAEPSSAMVMVSLKSDTRQLLANDGVEKKQKSRMRIAEDQRCTAAVPLAHEVIASLQVWFRLPRTLPRPPRGQPLAPQRIASPGTRTSLQECWLEKIGSWYSDRAPQRCNSGGRSGSYLRSGSANPVTG